MARNLSSISSVVPKAGMITISSWSGFEGYELLSVGVLEKLDAAGQEVGVDLGVVDHFAEQEDAFAGVFFDGAERDLNGVFDTVAEAEVAGEVDVEAAVGAGRIGTG